MGKVYSIYSAYNSTKKDLVASNFSTLLSKNIDEKILVIDFETPFPTLDHHFKVDKHIFLSELHSDKPLTGVQACASAVDKGILKGSLIKKFSKEISNNLYLLTGLYDIDDFEQINEESIREIILKAKEEFDIVIISVNSFMANAFTYISLVLSNEILIVTEDTLVNARANIHLIKELEKFHQVEKEKFKIIIVDNFLDDEISNKLYEGFELIKINWNEGYMKALSQKKIEVSNNSKAKKEYNKIIEFLGFETKKGLIDIIYALRKKEDEEYGDS